MFNLYIKIAIRYLQKNKLYTFINIFGLAIGMASFILIMIYVNYERSYDKFEGSEYVYRTYMDYLEGDTYVAGDAMTYNLSGPVLKREFPEVIEQVRFFYFENVTFVLGNKILEQPVGSLADQTYFEVFKYPLLKGNTNTALKEPNRIVLTKTLSKKLFGELDPMYQSLSIFWSGKEVLLTVSGIMEDIPKNSHFKNNFLISFETEKTWGIFGDEQTKPNWSMNNYYTYIKVNENTNINLLRQKIIDSNIEESERERHNIEAIEDIHLYSNKPYEIEVNGSIARVKFLTAIAFIILILSWLNYINLATAKSLERAKEIGIRKVAGAQKVQLALQSLLESILLNVAAITIAILIVVLLMPVYSNITDKTLNLQLSDLSKFLPMLSFVFLGLILAGLYPALLLSSYSPIKALKGKINASANGLNIRKGLIITQFLATIILLAGTIVITKQINFLEKQSIGVDLSQILALKGEVISSKQDSILRKDFKVLETELKKLPFVEMISLAQTYPGDSYDNLSSTRGMTLPNGVKSDNKIFYTYHVQSDYFKLMGIEFLAGGTFLPTASGQSSQVVVNEKFIKEMGIASIDDILNKKLKFWGNNEWVVSGIIKDYNHFGLKNPIQPLLIRNQNDINNLLVKLNPASTSATGFGDALAQIQSKWTQIFPESTFNYTFLDKKFEAQYNEDKKFSMVFQIFTILAILIASMGLFGLTSYTCIQRKKEIGIRKVNGATIEQILSLLNRDFVKWIGIAFVIAVPLSWYAMKKWLEGFAYKTTISWWIFILAGIVVLCIALLTVSWQSFKAAINNPVDALRDE